MRRARPSTICWGELLWDLFPDGRRLGGAPANVAYHLAGLGVSVALATRLGDDDAGRDAVAALDDAGVDTALVQVDTALPTGAVEVALEGGEPSYRLRDGCAWERIEASAAVLAALRGCRALCFGSLALRAPAGRAGFAAAVAAAAPGCLRVCDPNLRPGQGDDDALRAALEAADVVKINEGEARLVEARLGVGDAVAWLHSRGARLVALTRGPRGSRLLDAGGAVADHPGVPAIPGGDNVGAGDAFTAVLIAGLLAGRSLEEISEAANRYAAHVASRRGATPPVPAALVATLLAGWSFDSATLRAAPLRKNGEVIP
jgi:fructokinase